MTAAEDTFLADITGRKVMAYDDRLEWLRARMRGIGASDAPAVCHVADRPRWCSEARVYESKIVDPEDLFDDDDDNENREAGSWLEEPIARRCAKVEGMKLVRRERHFVARDEDYLMASPDFIVTKPDREGLGVLQIKNVIGFASDKWADTPPLYVQVQVQHELHVTGLRWGVIGALVGGFSLRTFYVEAHDEFVKRILVPRCHEFWHQHVLPKIPPVISPEDADHRALARIYKAAEKTVELPAEADALVAEWEEIQGRDDASRLDAIKNQLRIWIGKGGGDVGLTPGGREVTWKESRRGERVYRSIRLRKSKEEVV